MTTPIKLIQWARGELERSCVPLAEKDAESLFMHCFNLGKKEILLADNFRPDPASLDHFRQTVALRANRFPLQYIVKDTEFMGLKLALEKGVFIPRPETELLVKKAGEYIATLGQRQVNILDLGTGSGNIAISLTKHWTNCKIITSDISQRALTLAAKNASLHGVRSKIRFVKSFYFSNIPVLYRNYLDIIISNPPYVRTGEMRGLQREIAYEDKRALDGGATGLNAYRRILSEGPRFLNREGVIALEIGYDQARHVRQIAERSEGLSSIDFFKDHNGFQRVAIARYRKEDTNG